MSEKLNDIQVRFLKKIFITWLKKEGYYEDYINAKMYLNNHPLLPPDPYSDGWPHSLNENKLYYDYDEYSNIIDRTINYAICMRIRSDWPSINYKWNQFALKNKVLLMDSFLKSDWEK